jgi:hypothetical protein
MSQDEEEKIEQSEGEKGKDNLEPSPSVESNKETSTSEQATYHCHKIEQPEKLYWGKFRMADLIQLGGVGLTFLTLLAFIFVSTRQINIADKSIELTDSSFIYTKRSILASDSSTKEALRISDSSLAIAKKSLGLTSRNIEIIRDNARTELRAYINFDSAYFYDLRNQQELIINMRITNVGKTPAYNVRSLMNVKIGGKPEIHESDFSSLRDTVSPTNIGGNNGYMIFSGKANIFLDSVYISNASNFIGIYAKFFYEDIFGNQDSLRICRVYDRKYHAFVNCNKDIYEENSN